MPMLMPRIVRLTLFVLAALVSSVAATEACSCARLDAAPACELYKRFDVAFVGRAAVVPPHRGSGRVQFRVTQALKGVAGPDVTVVNDDSGIGCGYQFDQGEDYVVFASRDADGEIEIAPCSSTIWMVHVPDYAYAEFRREAAEAVAFAASLRKPAEGGRIFGEVGLSVPFRRSSDANTTPVDGATVILRGEGPERRTPSVDGRYEFTGVPRGTYRVSVTMPDGFPPARSARPPEYLLSRPGFLFDFEREDTRSVTIEDSRGCGYAVFEAEYEGEIAGTVLGHDGTPVKGMTVEAFPEGVDPQREEIFGPRSMTDARGEYHISKLPPGRYIVGINLRDEPSESMPFLPTLYREPGSDGPSVIELGNSSHVQLSVLRLPAPTAERQIAGTVTRVDGRPVGRFGVLVCEDRSGRRGDYCRSADVSADGRFSVVMLAGRTYKIKAEESFPPIGTAEVTVSLDADVTGLRLVLVPPRNRPR